ncbi:unnamed protein product [Peniophora sp. CBMAI 1063]|nr:unnamed protein product [Peniophora sp. CBMAI 1063]
MNAWFTPAILQRARQLDIYADKALADHLWPRLPAHMNFLQKLRIEAFERNEILALPQPLLDLPAVTSLHLQGYHVPWRSALMSPQLTELDIGYWFPSRPLPYEVLRDMLSSLQFLERLILCGINVRFSTPFDQIPNIVLSLHLMKLEIHTEVEQGDISTNNLMLMSLLQTPPGCNRLVSIQRETGETAPLEGILARLIPLFSLVNYKEMGLRQLWLEEHAMTFASTPMMLQDSTVAHQSSYNRTAARLDLAPSLDAYPLNLYLPFVPVGRLRTLFLDGWTTRTLSSHNLWPELLRAEEVWDVKLTSATEGHDYATFFDVLRNERLGGDSNSHSAMLFPRMEQLALPLSGVETASTDVIADLIKLIHARQHKGAPIKKLLVPKEVEHWISWDTLRTMMNVTTVIDGQY